MNLRCLLSLIKKVPAYSQLEGSLTRLKQGKHRLVVLDAAKSYVVAALYQDSKLPTLVVTSQPENAKRLHEQLQTWCTQSGPIQLFPEPHFMADEYSEFDHTTMMERLQTLSNLSFYPDASSKGQPPPLIIISAAAAVRKTTPQTEFSADCHRLNVGMKIDPLRLVEKWQTIGYRLENFVEIPGAISRRGGIIDIFPPHSKSPARIEFFGNQIDSIRLFDPKTQRSSTLETSITVTPAEEKQFAAETSIILDYMPEGSLLILDNPDEIEATVNKLHDRIEDIQQAKIEQNKLTSYSPLPYLSWAEFKVKTDKIKPQLTLYPWKTNATDDNLIQSLPFASMPGYGGRIEVFLGDLKQMLEENRRIVIISQQTNRLSELLQEQDIFTHPISQLGQAPPLKSVTLVQGSLEEGWALKDIVTLFSDKEIFGLVKQRRILRKRPVPYHWFAFEPVPGEYVVHIEHGIAKFAGLTKMLTDGVEREYIILEYAAGDRLYVPSDQIDRVNRYTGAGDQPPSLSRLGTQEWARTKQRIKASVAEIAQELLNLYASREIIPGLAFSSDNIWQQELEASFPYIETPDQLEAVHSVKSDMEKPKPMDRLVCGDVGYGKTEVALRASFKAVMDNKQVALLVPTTILAQQHFNTFRGRLLAFPIRVETLSRFCSEKEQNSIIEGLAAGTVDICIGTHRLLQKDVTFKNLGLVIIDEEQRFGVTHKEHFKKLRQEIDILTLTATPIPRTLHLSLSGIRDISTMETPPEERLPIKTYVGAYSEKLIREAILGELERNGQVFFVHNRVQSIASVAAKLDTLIPEARTSVAHGQMPKEELERVMSEFADHKSDVLVTTTIIESGLDLPNVNTLIIDQADRLGLTQLYQLRGRVGRGSNHAHAYFLFDKDKQLTPQSRKRLKTISEATELGAGFAIAMRDMEIRGAGNLLGIEQSGYIAAVGFDLYCHMLTEALEELREKKTGQVGEKTSIPPAPAIALPLNAHISEDYIPTPSTRISFYQRLVSARHSQEIDDVAIELNDRFGVLPQPVKNLIYIAKIRQIATYSEVESISTKGKQIVVVLNKTGIIKDSAIFEHYNDKIKIGTRQIILNIEYLKNSWQEVLKEVLHAIVRNNG